MEGYLAFVVVQIPALLVGYYIGMAVQALSVRSK